MSDQPRLAANVDPVSPLALAMLPSLGYFGGWRCDVLKVDVPTGLVSIKITNLSESVTPLELKGVRLYKNGSQTKINLDQVRNEQSSLQTEGKSDPNAAWELKDIRTAREIKPWWKSTFSEPQDTDQLLVFNRPDRLGRRSRKLSITIADSSGLESVVYDSTSREYFSAVLTTISKFAGTDVSQLPVSNPAQAKAWREQVVNRVVDNLATGIEKPTEAEWNHIAALLPTDPDNDLACQLKGNDWFLLAYGLTAQVNRGYPTRGSFKPYSDMLSTTGDLERLDTQFDSVAQALDFDRVMLTRHGIVPATKLRGLFPALADMAREVGVAIEEFDSNWMIAYGTLLGAVREGRAIPHDDDFDMFCTIEASNENGFYQKRAELLDFLEESGWVVTPNGQHDNFHVEKEGNRDIRIDIFALWMGPEKARAHMEKMKRRDMPRVWFEATKLIEIEDELLPAPIGSEEFLADRYGDTWRVPNQYDDWIWPLADVDTATPTKAKTSVALGSKMRKAGGRVKRNLKKRIKKH